MRSADQDTTRPQVAHTWSGQWQWQVGNVQMPYVSLYAYLFSPSNPNTERLDSAYRSLAEGLRNQSCLMCHSPDNYAAITPLEFFNYPNQALAARNSIIARLNTNNMPPAANDSGLPAGIASDADRQELITLAQEFKAGETRPWPTRASRSSTPGSIPHRRHHARAFDRSGRRDYG